MVVCGPWFGQALSVCYCLVGQDAAVRFDKPFQNLSCGEVDKSNEGLVEWAQVDRLDGLGDEAGEGGVEIFDFMELLEGVVIPFFFGCDLWSCHVLEIFKDGEAGVTHAMGETVAYKVGLMMSPRWPQVPPPRLLGTRAASL